MPNPRTITSTLSGSGTIDPSGAQTYYDGDSYTLTITPTDINDTVTATKDGVDITSQLVPPGSGSGTEEQVLGTYALTSGGFNGSGGTYFQGLVGKGYNNSTQTTTNYYSSGSSTIAVFTYEMPVTVPSNATITDCYVMVNGHAESTSQSSEYMCAQLYAGSTALSSELNFKSIGTSNSTQTIQATTLPTAAQCSTLKLQCRLGYYGGAINGATVFVTYSYSIDYYTYTYTVSGNATIAVTIGGSGSSPKIYAKIGSGGETQVAQITGRDMTTYSCDLSSFSNGDTLRFYGKVVCSRSGNYSYYQVNIDDSFTWSNSNVKNYYYDDSAYYTITYTSSAITIQTTGMTYEDFAVWGYNGFGGSYAYIYKVTGNPWVEAVKVYKKVNGSWVEQSDLTTVFSSGVNYIKGG